MHYNFACILFNSGLSFGRVDEYGRFERNIEPDPDKNKGTLLYFYYTLFYIHIYKYTSIYTLL